MPFVPASDKDREYMLSKIGVQNFEQLIENIPSEVRYRGGMDFPEQLSEYEVTRLMHSYSNMNNSASSHICFMGGGAYERYNSEQLIHLIKLKFLKVHCKLCTNSKL